MSIDRLDPPRSAISLSRRRVLGLFAAGLAVGLVGCEDGVKIPNPASSQDTISPLTPEKILDRNFQTFQRNLALTTYNYLVRDPAGEDGEEAPYLREFNTRAKDRLNGYTNTFDDPVAGRKNMTTGIMYISRNLGGNTRGLEFTIGDQTLDNLHRISQWATPGKSSRAVIDDWYAGNRPLSPDLFEAVLQDKDSRFDTYLAVGRRQFADRDMRDVEKWSAEVTELHSIEEKRKFITDFQADATKRIEALGLR